MVGPKNLFIFCWIITFSIAEQLTESSQQIPQVILTGLVHDFFGQTSALVKVIKIFKGADHRIQNNFVIFQNMKICPYDVVPRWNIYETRLFFGQFKFPGVFSYQCGGLDREKTVEDRRFRSTNGKDSSSKYLKQK